MRKTGNLLHSSVMGTGPASFQEGNPKVWVQLDDEPRNTNLDIMVTIQELKDEMARLQEDNQRLMQEQEKIMKSLSDRQNHWPLAPNPESENTIGEQEFRTENMETKGGEEKHEQELDNV